jgi:hypothetical protein
MEARRECLQSFSMAWYPKAKRPFWRMALQSLRLAAKERWQYQQDNQDVQWGQANCPQSCAKKGHWRDSPGLAMVRFHQKSKQVCEPRPERCPEHPRLLHGT